MQRMCNIAHFWQLRQAAGFLFQHSLTQQLRERCGIHWCRLEHRPQFTVTLGRCRHRPDVRYLGLHPSSSQGAQFRDSGYWFRAHAYAYGSAQNLNACDRAQENRENNERRVVYGASPFQSAVRSIHLYLLVTAVERAESPISELVSTKHGTQ
jgi:hypothetical protein